LLEAKCVQINLPLKQYPPRETILAQMKECKERYRLERLERMLAISDRLGSQSIGAFPVTVWRVGDAYLVATTGERTAAIRSRCANSLRVRRSRF